VATDDLHAPLGLDRPAAGRPVIYSVAAAVLGIAAAAVVVGIATWYEPLTRSQPAPAPATAATPARTSPEPVVVSAPATSRVYAPGTAQPPSRSLPQMTPQIVPQAMPNVTGAIPPAGASSQDQAAAAGGTDRIITIIDGRSGARQEVRIPATSDPATPDPSLADVMRVVPGGDEASEPAPQPSRAKPNAAQKRAKPGPAMSTNSAPQAPMR
jgi:hypothetical protein